MLEFQPNIWYKVDDNLYETLNIKSYNIDIGCEIKLNPSNNSIIINGFKLNDGYDEISVTLKYDEIFKELKDK